MNALRMITMSVAKTLDYMDQNKKMLVGSTPTLEKSAQDLVEIMQRANLLHGKINLNHLIDGRFLLLL